MVPLNVAARRLYAAPLVSSTEQRRISAQFVFRQVEARAHGRSNGRIDPVRVVARAGHVCRPRLSHQRRCIRPRSVPQTRYASNRTSNDQHRSRHRWWPRLSPSTSGRTGFTSECIVGAPLPAPKSPKPNGENLDHPAAPPPGFEPRPNGTKGRRAAITPRRNAPRGARPSSHASDGGRAPGSVCRSGRAQPDRP